MNANKIIIRITLKRLMLLIATLALLFFTVIYFARVGPRARRYSQYASTLEMFEKAERAEADRFAKSAEHWRKEIEKLEAKKKTAIETEEDEKHYDNIIKNIKTHYNTENAYSVEMLKQANKSKILMHIYKKAANHPWMEVEPASTNPE